MNLKQWQRSKKIKAEAEAAAKRTVERVLNAVKEPAMSEFKVGDYVVHPKFSDKGLYKIYEMSGSIIKVQLMPNGRKSYSFESDIRHATPEEIAAGHRIDKPSNSGELETIDRIENHISPNCEVKNG